MCLATTRINWSACTCGHRRARGPRGVGGDRRELFDGPRRRCSGTFRCRHKDGTVRWTEGVARNLLGEPRVGAIVVYYRDVTSRKRPRRRSSATEDRYGHCGRRRPTSSSRRIRGLFPLRQSRDLRVFGYPSNEVVGRRFTEFIRADYRPAILQHYSKQVPNGRANSYIEFPAVTKDGVEVWLGQNAWLVFDAKGQVHRHAGRGARHHRAQARRGRAAAAEAKYRSGRRAVARRRLHRPARSACLRQSQGADILGYSQQELLEMPNVFALVHEQDRSLLVDQLSRIGGSRIHERAAHRERACGRTARRAGRDLLHRHGVRESARGAGDRDRHQRSREAGRPVAAGAEDGGRRAAWPAASRTTSTTS